METKAINTEQDLKKGNVPFNKGKVFMPDRPGRFGSTGYYVTPERADAIHYGLDGEVHSARVKVAHNKGKKIQRREIHMNDFEKLVKEMREAQKRFFAAKNPGSPRLCCQPNWMRLSP